MKNAEIQIIAREELEKLWYNSFEEIVDYDLDDQKLDADFIVDIDIENNKVEIYSTECQWGYTTASQNNGFCFMSNCGGVTFSDVLRALENFIDHNYDK